MSFSRLWGALLVGIFVFLSSRVQANVFTQLRQICEKMSAQHALFVGIGRSPLPFLAQLQKDLGPSQTLHIPWSSLRDYQPQKNPEANEYIDWYLDQAFSGQIQIKNRPIVVFDFVYSGLSFRALRWIFDGYFTRRGFDLRNIRYVALLARNAKLSIPRSSPPWNRAYRLPRELSQAVFHREFKAINPYTSDKFYFFKELEWFRENHQKPNFMSLWHERKHARLIGWQDFESFKQRLPEKKKNERFSLALWCSQLLAN